MVLEPGKGQALRIRQRNCRRRNPQGIHKANRRRNQGSYDKRRCCGLSCCGRKVRLVFGSFHEVDSSKWRSRWLASLRSRMLWRSFSILLEPIMKVK
ncbi:MAG: hypothetical protein ACLUKN_07800 [Bacilli bacterium]